MLVYSHRAMLRREETVTKNVVTWTEVCSEEMRCELEAILTISELNVNLLRLAHNLCCAQA